MACVSGEDSALWGCGSWWVSTYLKAKELCCFEISGNINPVTLCHIPEDQNPENLKFILYLCREFFECCRANFCAITAYLVRILSASSNIALLSEDY
jgi:hypothetical protein